MGQKEKVSVVIPTKNEELGIAEVIAAVKPYADEILVVDGHSKDTTRSIAESHGARVVLDNKKGKGDAVRCGLEAATGDIVVFIDADGSHDADDIPKMVAPILEKKADLVIGSRGTGGSDELHGDIEKFIRITGSGLILVLINYRFNVRLTDSQNGFRAIRRSVGLAIGLKENITTIEQEMMIKCLKQGYKVSEVPAHEYARKHGTSNISLRKTSFRYVYSMLKYLYFS